MDKKDGGPAFPAELVTERVGGQITRWSTYKGMSLRDWFAGMAMQGLLSNPALVDVVTKDSENWIASKARSQADAMIAEREKEKGDI